METRPARIKPFTKEPRPTPKRDCDSQGRGPAPDESECLTEVSASADGKSLSWNKA